MPQAESEFSKKRDNGACRMAITNPRAALHFPHGAAHLVNHLGNRVRHVGRSGDELEGPRMGRGHRARRATGNHRPDHHRIFEAGLVERATASDVGCAATGLVPGLPARTAVVEWLLVDGRSAASVAIDVIATTFTGGCQSNDRCRSRWCEPLGPVAPSRKSRQTTKAGLFLGNAPSSSVEICGR